MVRDTDFTKNTGCTVQPDRQLEVVQQVVLTCIIVAFAEVVLVPASSAQFFRKQVAETLSHCNNVFKEVWDSRAPGTQLFMAPADDE